MSEKSDVIFCLLEQDSEKFNSTKYILTVLADKILVAELLVDIVSNSDVFAHYFDKSEIFLNLS